MQNFVAACHPELNPIEMVWGYVKSYVAKYDTRFSLAESSDLLTLP